MHRVAVESLARLPLRLCLAAVCGIWLTTAADAAKALDPTQLHRFDLRRAQSSRADSPAPLPLAPRVRWRVRVGGNVLYAPVVAPDGEIVLALGSQSLVQYDAQGRQRWSRRLGNSNAAASPLIARDGARVALSESNELFAFSPSGRLLGRSTLPLGGSEAAPELSTTLDGGVVIAQGRRVVELDAGLRPRWSVRSPADVRALLGTGKRPLLVTTDGAVFELSLQGALEPKGAFAGRVDAVTQPSPTRAIALLDGRRLSELNLQSGALSTLLAEPDLELLRPLGSNGRGELRVLGGADLLIGFDATGAERFRSPLPSTALGLRASSNEILMDAAGTSLVVRGSQDLLAVRNDGEVSRVDGTACMDPLRPASLGPASIVFACRSGIVVRLDDAAAPRP